jgi:microcystin degradation protein MlrC
MEQIQQAAEQFKHQLNLAEEQFSPPGIPAAQAVERAIKLSKVAKKPVILADVQDNPGAGGTADTMGLLKELVRQRASGAVCGIIADASAVQEAVSAGVDSAITVSLGGKGFAGDSPLQGEFKVLALGDGDVVGTGPMWKGARMQLGPCTLLEYRGIKIAVSTQIVQTGDTALFRHLGVHPEQHSIVAIKSSVHFRAAFETLAEAVILSLSPGSVIADPQALRYLNLRKNVRIGPNQDH